MDDIREKVIYDEQLDRLTIARTQDIQPYLEDNAELRSTRSEFQKYKGNLVKAASIPSNVVEMMMRGQCCNDGKTYNLMSPDNDERRRALVHVQSVHRHLMTVNGNPFALRRNKWA